MTDRQRQLVLDVLKDARNFNLSRSVFHEAHVGAAQRAWETDKNRLQHLSPVAEYHQRKADWHRQTAEELRGASKELQDGWERRLQ